MVKNPPSISALTTGLVSSRISSFSSEAAAIRGMRSRAFCTCGWTVGMVSPAPRKRGPIDYRRTGRLGQAMATQRNRPCYSRPMTARLSNLPPTRIEKLETFLIERWCLLRIHCEDGTVGTGEAGVHGWPRPAAAMIGEMQSYLVGRDPSTIEHHAQALQRHSHFIGALVGGAISAIDIALWDIKAKRYGVPIYELMGGKT